MKSSSLSERGEERRGESNTKKKEGEKGKRDNKRQFDNMYVCEEMPYLCDGDQHKFIIG
jgi:hypothetical protein